MRCCRSRMVEVLFWDQVDTFVCLDVYFNRHLTKLPPLPTAPTVRGAPLPQCTARSSPRAQAECIEAEITDLPTKEAIRELPPPEWWAAGSVYSKIFTVPKQDGSFRPCLTLRPSNTCIVHRTFGMEWIETVKELLQPGDWCGKIDLRGAYLQIRFDQDLCRLLRFTWRGRAFECLTLMFGLSEAPWLFSKTMRAPVR